MRPFSQAEGEAAGAAQLAADAEAYEKAAADIRAGRKRDFKEAEQASEVAMAPLTLPVHHTKMMLWRTSDELDPLFSIFVSSIDFGCSLFRPSNLGIFRSFPLSECARKK